MGWFGCFGKKKDTNMNMMQNKCEGCGKAIVSSECVKSANGKCWCKDCNAKQRAK